MNLISFDLCAGGSDELYFEFKDVSEREIVWNNLQNNHGWQPEWADKQGNGSGSRCGISIYLSKLPYMYRWKVQFRE